jgi:hypothetical protein
MNKSNVKLGVLIVVMVILVGCIPVAGAENTTGADNLTNQTLIATASSETPFITIDPIGNHTIGDVFFINGTTSLSVTENLTGGIRTTAYIMAMKSSHINYPSAILPDISIVSTPSGTNRWSVNVTDVVVTNLNDQPEWSPYVVVVRSKENSSIEAYQEFSLLPATNATPVTALQTTIQRPSPVQPTTSAVTVLPTTRSSPLPVALPIAILAAIVILRSSFRKKGE